MLIREIITESEVSSEISDDLMDLIVTCRKNKKTEIPMNGPNGALAYLQKLGYTVSVDGLMTLLSSDAFSDMIERSDPSKITLTSPMPDQVSKDKMQQSKDKVDRTATKVATDNVKTGDEL